MKEKWSDAQTSTELWGLAPPPLILAFRVLPLYIIDIFSTVSFLDYLPALQRHEFGRVLYIKQYAVARASCLLCNLPTMTRLFNEFLRRIFSRDGVRFQKRLALLSLLSPAWHIHCWRDSTGIIDLGWDLAYWNRTLHGATWLGRKVWTRLWPTRMSHKTLPNDN